MKLPLARRDGLVVTTIENETLIYDLDRQRAYALNAAAAAIWDGCTGTASIAALAGATALPSDIVWYGLWRLRASRLLEVTPDPSPASRLTRRAALRLMRDAGLAAIAIPAILTLVTPSPLVAASCLPNGSSCSSNMQCCSGHCGILGINLVCLP